VPSTVPAASSWQQVSRTHGFECQTNLLAYPRQPKVSQFDAYDGRDLGNHDIGQFDIPVHNLELIVQIAEGVQKLLRNSLALVLIWIISAGV
jgi:hypothetical protein